MALGKSKIITFVSAIVLSGCSFASDALFPSLTGDDIDENRVEAVVPSMENVGVGEVNTPPTLGATEFKPLNVTQGSDTGTFVGKNRITSYNVCYTKLLRLHRFSNTRGKSLRMVLRESNPKRE